jgi:sugar/nucleoside kinase (ribokinase family)
MKQKSVLAIGDVNIDIVFTGLPEIPRAEQEFLAEGMEIVVGGQTSTIARALASLGLRVIFVGKLGDDAYGHQAIEQLKEDNVDVSGITVEPDLRTGVTVSLSTGSERAFATYLGSISRVSRDDVKPEFLRSVDHVHVGSFYLQQTLRPNLAGLFEECRAIGLTTSLDPGWDPLNEWKADILDVLKHVTVFLPNETEAMTITGADSPQQAIDLLGEHADIVLIKMGDKGCLARDREEKLYLPAHEVTVVDVTSAGDACNAGFLYGFVNGRDLRTSTQFANACGALAVTQVGSLGITSGPEEVESFLASATQSSGE